MAMTKSYYCVDGVMIGYSDENGHKDVLTDALGNITGEVDETGNNLTYKAEYSPLGKTISSSGSSTSGFGWLGANGYREARLSYATHYVRARHYSRTSGSWTSVDQLWPYQRAYGYVGGRVTVHIDPSGMNWDHCPKPNPMEDGWNNLKKFMGPICKNPKPIQDCWKKCGEHDWEKEAECFCKHATGDPKYPVAFSCSYSEEVCKTGVLGLRGSCIGTTRGSWMGDCNVTICPNNCPTTGIDWMQALFHEMMHCCGADHNAKRRGGVQADPDCLEDCLRGVVGWPNSLSTPPWPGWPTDLENRLGDGTCS